MPRSNAAWKTYEQVTAWIVEQISARVGVRTTRLEPGRLVGKGTTNQIDLIWEFIDHYDRRIRLLFECRSYATRIEQSAVHAWRSVVDDVAQDGWETLGVIVTTTGYQAGATRLAETYGITIFELRTPSAWTLRTEQCHSL